MVGDQSGFGTHWGFGSWWFLIDGHDLPQLNPWDCGSTLLLPVFGWKHLMCLSLPIEILGYGPDMRQKHYCGGLLGEREYRTVSITPLSSSSRTPGARLIWRSTCLDSVVWTLLASSLPCTVWTPRLTSAHHDAMILFGVDSPAKSPATCSARFLAGAGARNASSMTVASHWSRRERNMPSGG
jgi:hypothetical protein